MKKVYLVIIAVILIAGTVYSYYYPVIINGTFDIMQQFDSKKVYKRGDIIMPFKDFDFDSGDYTAYIIIKDRIDLTERMPHAGVLKTKDISLLKGLQNVEFTYFGGDMATVENEFLLYKGNKLVFSSNVVIG